MKNLVLSLAEVATADLQSIDMRLHEEMPVPKTTSKVRVAMVVRSIVEFVAYAVLMLAVLGATLLIAAYVALHIAVYTWVWMDQTWPRPVTQESSNVLEINKQSSEQGDFSEDGKGGISPASDGSQSSNSDDL